MSASNGRTVDEMPSWGFYAFVEFDCELQEWHAFFTHPNAEAVDFFGSEDHAMLMLHKAMAAAGDPRRGQPMEPPA